jgi:hypothetical protein
MGCQKMAMQTTTIAASIYRAPSRLVLFVIHLNREGTCDKKSNRSDGCGEKRDGIFYCVVDPTNKLYAASADSVRSRVD